MTGPEELLTDALHDRVDRRDLPSTPMGEVVSTAHRFRRRRRVRNGVVAAAVVAVLAVPFVIDARHRLDTTPTPADQPSTDSWADPDPRVRLADVALGEPPAVAWIDGSDYVAADGTRTTLPVDQIGSATPYAGGFLVAARSDHQLTLLDSRLQEVWRRCATPGLAVSQDGLRTAYPTGNCGATTRGVLHFGPTDGTSESVTPFPSPRAVPVGFFGDAVVVSSYRQGPPVLIDPDGTSTTIDALRFVSGIDNRLGLVSGQLASGGDLHPTGAVVDPRTGSVKWRSRGWVLGAFSPDGSMVVGRRAIDASGWGVFDAETGERVHEFAMPRGFSIDQMVWENDEHLLMSTTQIHVQALLRTTLDGAIQRASDVAPYDTDEGEVRRFGLPPDTLP